MGMKFYFLTKFIPNYLHKTTETIEFLIAEEVWVCINVLTHMYYFKTY